MKVMKVKEKNHPPSNFLDWLSQNRDSHIINNVIINHLNDDNIKEECMETVFKRLFELPSGTKLILLFLFLFSCAFCVPEPSHGFGLDICGLETALLIGAGVSAAAGIGSSLVNAGSQHSANEANKRMVEDTNATNYKIQQEINEQNYKIWQEQLGQRMYEIEYDSPVNSRARSEAAGYNPYFADVPTGNVDSVLSPTAPTMHAASMEAPHVNPVQYDFSSVGNVVNEYFQNSYTATKTKEQNINNETLSMRNIADLRDKLASGELKGAERKLAEFQLDAAMKKLPNELKQQLADIDMTNAKIGETQAQTSFINTQNEYQKLLMEWYPEITQAQLDNINASVGAANASAFASYAAGKCSLKQVEVATQQAFKLAAEMEGVKINNYHLRRLNPIIRDNARKTGENITVQTAKTWQDATSLDFGIVKAPGGAAIHNIKGYKKSKTYQRNK